MNIIKLKVLKQFRDKNTNKLYNRGEIITVKKDRGEELIENSQNLVEKIIERKSAKNGE